MGTRDGVIDRPDPATAEALARLYDLDLHDDPGDLDLYLALADRADGPVLELAAGTGRLAIPLATAGHQVTAVDIDPAMMARARDRATRAGVLEDRLDFVEADLLGLGLADAGRYGFVFVALNSIMLLATREGQRAAFRTMAAHLRPGGIAAVDAWLPDAEDLGRFDGRIFLEWVRREPASGAVVTKTGSALHDAATGTIALTAIFEEAMQGEVARRWVRQDRLRLVSADELVAFADEAGLRVEVVAGGYDLGPIGPGSDRAILIAERA
jgi:SAM-dependent methyltransferase